MIDFEAKISLIIKVKEKTLSSNLKRVTINEARK